jgi:hypothetical protein
MARVMRWISRVGRGQDSKKIEKASVVVVLRHNPAKKES